VKLLDANLLIYADNLNSPEHEVARGWLTGALGGTETVLVPWVSALAYLRISTHSAVFTSPHTIERAATFLRDLYSSTQVVADQPDRGHLDRVGRLLNATGVGGNLVNDAHLGALALQYDATIVSFDNDFSRFPGVRWERPTVPVDKDKDSDR
jgi:uncharacterized protein